MQREGHLLLVLEGGVATGEDQFELVVGHDVCRLLVGGELGSDPVCRDLFNEFASAPVAPYDVDRAVPCVVLTTA